MHCYESVDGLPLAAVTVRRFKLLLKRIWVKVMFYNVLSHMHYFQASSVLHWFLVKCLIASWMQYNSVLSANMVYISKWYTALTGRIHTFIWIWEGSENWAPTGCREGRCRRRLVITVTLLKRGAVGCHEGVWGEVDCVMNSRCWQTAREGSGGTGRPGRSLSWLRSCRRLVRSTPTVKCSWIGSGYLTGHFQVIIENWAFCCHLFSHTMDICWAPKKMVVKWANISLAFSSLHLAKQLKVQGTGVLAEISPWILF